MKTKITDQNKNDFKEWEDFLKEIRLELEPKIEEELRIYNHIAWSEIMYKFFDKRPFAA